MTHDEVREIAHEVLAEENNVISQKSRVTVGLLIASLAVIIPATGWLIKSHYGLRDDFKVAIDEIDERVGYIEHALSTNSMQRAFEFSSLRTDINTRLDAIETHFRQTAIAVPDRWTGTMMQGWADRFRLLNPTNTLNIPDVRQVMRDYPLPYPNP